MTTLLDEPTTAMGHVPLRHARLPKWAPLLVGVLAIAGSTLVGLLLSLVALPLWSRAVENRRAATDRFVTALVWVALGLAFVPLVSLLWTVVGQGLPVLDAKFFT